MAPQSPHPRPPAPFAVPLNIASPQLSPSSSPQSSLLALVALASFPACPRHVVPSPSRPLAHASLVPSHFHLTSASPRPLPTSPFPRRPIAPSPHVSAVPSLTRALSPVALSPPHSLPSLSLSPIAPLFPPPTSKALHGYEFTQGFSKTGTGSSGTVSRFRHCAQTASVNRGSQLCTGDGVPSEGTPKVSPFFLIRPNADLLGSARRHNDRLVMTAMVTTTTRLGCRCHHRQ